jgi:hypothetical protein
MISKPAQTAATNHFFRSPADLFFGLRRLRIRPVLEEYCVRCHGQEKIVTAP